MRWSRIGNLVVEGRMDFDLSAPSLRMAGVFVMIMIPVALTMRQYTPLAIPLFWGLLAVLTALASLLAMKSFDSVVPALFVGNAIALVKTFIFPLPFQLWGTDSFSEVSFANTIVSTGHWLPTGGLAAATNYYGYFPAVHLLMAALSEATGLSTITISKYVIILVFTNLVIIAGYLVLKALVKEVPILRELGVSKLGLLYALSLGIVGIFVSRRLVGYTAVLLLMLLVSDSRFGNKRYFIIPFMAALLAISDHLSVYTGIPLFVVFVLARQRASISGFRSITLTGSIVLLWYGFIAWPGVLAGDLSGFTAAITQFASPSSGVSVQLGQSLLERLLPYFSEGLSALLGLLGFYLILRRLRRSLGGPTSLLFSLLYLVYVGVGLLITTTYSFVVNSVELVAALGLSIVILLALEHLPVFGGSRAGGRRGWRPLVFVALSLILISGNLMVLVSARYIDSVGGSRSTIDDEQVATTAVWSGGGWLSTFVRSGTSLYADQVIQGVYAIENVSVVSHYYDLLGSADALSRVLRPNASLIYLASSTRLTSVVYPKIFPLAPSFVSASLVSQRINIVYSNPDVELWNRPS